MRLPSILAISLAAVGVADARPVRRGQPPPEVSQDFWRDVVEPHADEVRRLITGARNGMKTADEALQMDAEWAVDQRMRYFEDAYGLMRYARKLSPENLEVLALLGRAADELGKTAQAIEALEAHAQLAGDKASPEALGRLGAIHLRRGDRDAAIRWLRRAQGPLRPDTVQPLVHLANALAVRGEVSAAVDTLVTALPATSVAYYSHELTLATFTLAVIYDRDEQRSAAFELLDRMKTTLQGQFGPQVQNALALLRFAPAEDQHYYLGLLYEVLDQYPEARAEFALYAASGAPSWRGRALEHVRDIDAQPRVQPKPATPPVPVPPQVRPVRPRRP